MDTFFNGTWNQQPANNYNNPNTHIADDIFRTINIVVAKFPTYSIMRADNGKLFIIKAECTKHKIALLQNEYNILTYLHSQGLKSIPQVYMPLTLGTKYHTLQENPKGISLYTMLTINGTPAHSVARYIFKQVVKTVDAIHEKNVAHRSITLESIFIDPTDASITINTFEYATQNLKKFTGEKCGPIPYYDENGVELYYPMSKDFYCLGVILFMLVFGMKIEINTDGKLICYGTAKEYLGIPWNNRENWKTLRKSLKISEQDDLKYLKCLLEHQLSKCSDMRLHCSGILKSKWAGNSVSTTEQVTEQVLKYLNPSK